MTSTNAAWLPALGRPQRRNAFSAFSALFTSACCAANVNTASVRSRWGGPLTNQLEVLKGEITPSWTDLFKAIYRGTMHNPVYNDRFGGHLVTAWEVPVWGRTCEKRRCFFKELLCTSYTSCLAKIPQSCDLAKSTGFLWLLTIGIIEFWGSLKFWDAQIIHCSETNIHQ